MTREGGFFFTGKDHETLIARTKDPHDNATPSGNSMAVTRLLRLHKLTGNATGSTRPKRTLELYRRLAGLAADGRRPNADRARLPSRARQGIRGRG